MRTIIDLPEDIYDSARAVAQQRCVPLSEALADLIREGLRADSLIDERGAFPCFIVPADARPITLAETLRAEDEL